MKIKLRKTLIIIMSIIAIPFLFIYFGIYYITPPFIVKPKIQKFINENQEYNFKIIEISKQNSPDLFHEPTGYSVILEDKEGVKFTIYIQKSKNNGWKTYMGSKISEDYNHAKEKVKQ